jgi:predicted ArsR family transcriptional regulator
VPPLLTGDAFTEPASIRAIAGELVVSEAAVKQHLSRLYVKFDVAHAGRRANVSSSPMQRSAAAPSRSATCAAAR